MKNYSLTTIICVLSLIIICLLVLFTGSRDKIGPDIKFSENCITVFDDNTDVKKLLSGVVATDEKDGDVTNSVRIQKIVVIKDDARLVVSYSAKDSSNNVSVRERNIEYKGTKDYIDYTIIDEYLFDEEASGEPTTEPTTPEETTPVVTSPSESTSNEPATPEESTTPEPTTPEETTSSQEEGFNSTPIDRAEVDRTGVPQIRMKYKTHTIPVGGDFFFMEALEEWYDDKDDVSRRVILIGEYDVNVPGTYTLTYYVTDSDLNVSNKETITLIVE